MTDSLAQPVVAQRRRATRWDLVIRRVVLVILLTALTIFNVIPFIWMLSGSFKTEYEIWLNPPMWIPESWRWQNYVTAWNALPFARWFVNTVLIFALSLVGAMLSNTLVAFGFARLRARWRNALFLVLLASMMLPHQVTWLSLYVMFAKIGWVNTYLPLVVPYFFASPFFVFLLRQFFLTIPIDLDEAARIDGASSLRVYWHIFMPTAGPVLAAMTIMIFMLVWKEYFLPLIYLNKAELFTLALGIQYFRGFAEYATQWHLLMAASTGVAMPPLLVFLFCQRYFIQGLTMTGLKG
jgi:multiple sugar transport system permease protein